MQFCANMTNLQSTPACNLVTTATNTNTNSITSAPITPLCFNVIPNFNFDSVKPLTPESGDQTTHRLEMCATPFIHRGENFTESSPRPQSKNYYYFSMMQIHIYNIYYIYGRRPLDACRFFSPIYERKKTENAEERYMWIFFQFEQNPCLRIFASVMHKIPAGLLITTL